MSTDQYKDTAKYYDAAYSSKADLKDTPFYIEQAKKYDGPILEIACGTGRILYEIAKLGMDIDGIDLCGDLLEILKKKLSNLPSNNVNVYLEDMRHFNLQKKYGLITIPFRPLQHMYTMDDQIKALTSAKNHLSDNGVLIFDVFYPRYDLLLADFTEETFEIEWEDPTHPQYKVRRYFVRNNTNMFLQYFDGEFIFRTFENEKLIKEERSYLKMSFYTYPQICLLLHHCGLEIVEEYGSFAKDPIDIEKEMIFVVRKKN